MSHLFLGRAIAGRSAVRWTALMMSGGRVATVERLSVRISPVLSHLFAGERSRGGRPPVSGRRPPGGRGPPRPTGCRIASERHHGARMPRSAPDQGHRGHRSGRQRPCCQSSRVSRVQHFSSSERAGGVAAGPLDFNIFLHGRAPGSTSERAARRLVTIGSHWYGRPVSDMSRCRRYLRRFRGV